MCLAQVILFSWHWEGEVASMPSSRFSSKNTSDLHEDGDWVLSEVKKTKKLCTHLSKIVIRGKCDHLVPILLTLKTVCVTTC